MAKIIAGAGVLAVVALVGAAVWIRVAPVDPALHRAEPLPQDDVVPMAGGHMVVLSPADPDRAFARLAGVIGDTPRTVRLRGNIEDGHVSFVTRSPVMGFADVTNLWRSGDRVAIRSHLTTGKSDMGVNRRRVEGWLAEADL